MARVKYGNGIEEIVGSIGGVCYQRNRSGKIAKARNRSTENRGGVVEVVQFNFANRAVEWVDLSAIQKETWTSFAGANEHVDIFGRAVVASAYNWFQLVNTYLFQMELPQLVVAPDYLLPSPVVGFSFEFIHDGMFLKWNENDYLESDYILIYASFVTSQRVGVTASGLRYLGYIMPYYSSEEDIMGMFNDAFGINVVESGICCGVVVNIRLVPVHSNSGINGGAVMVAESYLFPDKGIGVMIIEDTFIVG